MTSFNLVLFSTIHVCLLAIAYLLADRLIYKMQSRPITVQIVGNGHSLTEFAAAITFAIVEGTSRIATAKGAR